MSRRWTRSDWTILISITLLATVLRLYRLGVIPIGFSFDEAYNGIDAYLVMHGGRPLFLPANLGREPLYTFWQAIVATIGGLSPYTLRLSSAIFGIVTIPITYLMLRYMLQRQSRLIAAITSTALAISLWHIHFSHYGIRVIMMPVLLSGIFSFFWMGTHASSRGRFFVGYGLSGVLAGFSVWTHPTGRLVPIILVFYTLWVVWNRAESDWESGYRFRSSFAGLLFTGVVAFLIFLPLGIEFYHHPEYFLSHLHDVSIFNERVGGGAPFQTLVTNLALILGMFSWQGDLSWTHNLSGRPVFDLFLAPFFYLGLVIWSVRILRKDDPDRDALVLLGVWVVVMLWASILSDDAPDFSRTLATLPALFITIGLGLGAVATWRKTQPIWGGTIIAVILLVNGGMTVRDYFFVFPQRASEYYTLYDTHLRDAVDALVLYAGDHQIYLSQLWAEHPTIRFYRITSNIKSIDTSDTIVLPPLGLGAVYGFPIEQQDRAREIATLWNNVSDEVVLDRFGNPLLSVVRVSANSIKNFSSKGKALTIFDEELLHKDTLSGKAKQLIDSPVASESGTSYSFATFAKFEDAPMLDGVRTDSSGEEVTLFWRLEAQTNRDLTTFIHVFNQDDERIGQVDKRPGNGSYPTNSWSVNERVVERYHIQYDKPVRANSRIYLHIGWYELAAEGLRRTLVGTDKDSIVIGPLVVKSKRTATTP